MKRKQSRQLKTYARGYCNISLHVILSTYQGLPLIDDTTKDELLAIARRIAEKNAIEVVRAEVYMEAHLQLHLEIPPCVEIARFINAIKTISSRELRKSHEDLKRLNYFWSRVYFCISVGGSSKQLIDDYMNSIEYCEFEDIDYGRSVVS
jgi:putative transposase